MLLFAVGLEWSSGLSVVGVDCGWSSWLGFIIARRNARIVSFDGKGQDSDEYSRFLICCVMGYFNSVFAM